MSDAGNSNLPQATPGAWTAPGDAREIDARALGRHLWARRYRILVPTILAALLAAIAVNFITPYYTSEVRVLIESGQTVYNRPQGEGSSSDNRDVLDPEAILSQVQVISSRDLARQVIRDLKLDERPEFSQRGLVSRLLGLVGLSSGRSATEEEKILAIFYKNLTVYNLDRSRVIVIEYASSDPQLAANIANALAAGYLKLQQTSTANATRQSMQWLASEIASLRPRVADAEAKVESFRARANLYVGANGTSLSAQQLGEITSQIIVARTQKADAESRASAIRALLRSRDAVEASEIIDSSLIRALVERRILLQAALAEQSATLLLRHPRIRELRAQLADLDQQIRGEAESVVRGFDNDARVAGARADELSSQLDQLKKQATIAGEQDVQMRALEREARAQRDLLETYLGRYRDAAAREDPASVQPDARIISRAAPALEPTFPKKVPIILMASLAALLLMTALTAVGGIMSMPPSGAPRGPSPMPDPADDGQPQHLPWIGGRSATQSAGADAATGGPASESTLADLSALVELRGEAARLVIVTGPAEDEGVGRCALALARSLAASDRRTALVCLDTDSASLANLTPDPRAPGLTDLLFGVASFSEAIHRESGSRCHVIPPGRGAGSADSLVAADRLILILSALEQTYDHVIVAAPPLGTSEGVERIAALHPTLILVTHPGGLATDAVEAFDALAGRGFGEIAMVTFAGAPEEQAVAA